MSEDLLHLYQHLHPHPHPPPASTPTSTSTSTKSYPKPEVDFQEVVQSPRTFLQKLQSFHSYLGTKFRVPTVGGKDLDLHKLFVEVTSRGGIDKVVRDRRWKEVIGAFRFPSSITSASFVLRKYYLSLLYHFEQVYYFQREEPSISAADSAIGIVSGSVSVEVLDDQGTFNQCSEVPKLEAGSSVTGTIDAKFDYGYLVTVNLGTQKFNGVLYHTPQASGAAEHDRKRKQLVLKDPFRPKPNRSGYNFFFAEHYGRLKPSYQGQERAISKKIGALWSRLSEAEKLVYQEKGLKDKERYKSQMLEYKASRI